MKATKPFIINHHILLGSSQFKSYGACGPETVILRDFSQVQPNNTNCSKNEPTAIFISSIHLINLATIKEQFSNFILPIFKFYVLVVK
jgi:hypothetical protein